MERFNAEAKQLAEMQNEYTLLTSKKPSEMCHEDFIRAEELNLEIKDATKVMAALAIELAGYKKDEKGLWVEKLGFRFSVETQRSIFGNGMG